MKIFNILIILTFGLLLSACNDHPHGGDTHAHQATEKDGHEHAADDAHSHESGEYIHDDDEQHDHPNENKPETEVIYGDSDAIIESGESVEGHDDKNAHSDNSNSDHTHDDHGHSHNDEDDTDN